MISKVLEENGIEHFASIDLETKAERLFGYNNFMVLAGSFSDNVKLFEWISPLIPSISKCNEVFNEWDGEYGIVPDVIKPIEVETWEEKSATGWKETYWYGTFVYNEKVYTGTLISHYHVDRGGDVQVKFWGSEK